MSLLLMTFLGRHGFTMKNKDEVFNKFKEFKSLIENHTEKKIKIIHSDNGGEFTSTEFKDLCKEAGIKRELSTPYNPQQNGVAEWKNKISSYLKGRTKIRI